MADIYKAKPLYVRALSELLTRQTLSFDEEQPFSGCAYEAESDGTLTVHAVENGELLGPYRNDIIQWDPSAPWVNSDFLEEEGESGFYRFKGERYSGYSLGVDCPYCWLLREGQILSWVEYNRKGRPVLIELGDVELELSQYFDVSNEGVIERFDLFLGGERPV